MSTTGPARDCRYLRWSSSASLASRWDPVSWVRSGEAGPWRRLWTRRWSRWGLIARWCSSRPYYENWVCFNTIIYEILSLLPTTTTVSSWGLKFFENRHTDPATGAGPPQKWHQDPGQRPQQSGRHADRQHFQEATCLGRPPLPWSPIRTGKFSKVSQLSTTSILNI